MFGVPTSRRVGLLIRVILNSSWNWKKKNEVDVQDCEGGAVYVGRGSQLNDRCVEATAREGTGRGVRCVCSEVNPCRLDISSMEIITFVEVFIFMLRKHIYFAFFYFLFLVYLRNTLKY